MISKKYKKKQSVPGTLIINVGLDIQSQLEVIFRKTFGNTFSATLYSRPAIKKHPRMRPHKKPHFDLIVVDVATWIGNLADYEIINRDWLPWWFGDDFVDILKNALVVVLSPGKAFNGVKEQFDSYQNKCEIIDRDLVAQKDEFYEELRDIWEDWSSLEKQDRWEMFDKRFRPTE